jgi:hypothetical protein
MILGMESNETKRSVCCPICNEQIDFPASVTMRRTERWALRLDGRPLETHIAEHEAETSAA